MINAEIRLVLKWSEDCVLTKKAIRTRKEREGVKCSACS